MVLSYLIELIHDLFLNFTRMCKLRHCRLSVGVVTTAPLVMSGAWSQQLALFATLIKH